MSYRLTLSGVDAGKQVAQKIANIMRMTRWEFSHQFDEGFWFVDYETKEVL
jgi:hypothetical protein